MVVNVRLVDVPVTYFLVNKFKYLIVVLTSNYNKQRLMSLSYVSRVFVDGVT